MSPEVEAAASGPVLLPMAPPAAPPTFHCQLGATDHLAPPRDAGRCADAGAPAPISSLRQATTKPHTALFPPLLGPRRLATHPAPPPSGAPQGVFRAASGSGSCSALLRLQRRRSALGTVLAHNVGHHLISPSNSEKIS